MALRNLTDQIQEVENRITNAQLYPSPESVGMAHAEFKKLRFMLDGLTSFAEHRWMVKLYTPQTHVEIKVAAEHLTEAKDIAIELIDAFHEVVRYELYCDGILIPEEQLYGI